MVNDVLDPVPLIVFPEGTVAITSKIPFQPAANACVRKFKFDPVVRLNANLGSFAVKKVLIAANIMQTPVRSYHTKQNR
jgi:hypothetical protein